MLVLAVLVAALVLVAVAVVAAGRGGSMAPAQADSVHVALPEERPVAPEDIDGLRFDLGLRGYRMAEVDQTLDRLRVELARRDERIAELEAVTGTGAGGPQPGAAVAGGAEAGERTADAPRP